MLRVLLLACALVGVLLLRGSTKQAPFHTQDALSASGTMLALPDPGQKQVPSSAASEERGTDLSAVALVSQGEGITGEKKGEAQERDARTSALMGSTILLTPREGKVAGRTACQTGE